MIELDQYNKEQQDAKQKFKEVRYDKLIYIIPLNSN